MVGFKKQVGTTVLNWGCDVLNVSEDFSKLHELDLNYILLLKYRIINNMINMLKVKFS